MIKLNFKATVLGLTILSSTNYKLKAQATTAEVKIAGQMKNVIWKGEL